MNNDSKIAIPFCTFGGYVRFSSAWWKDLLWYATTGWHKDIRAFFHRARYGWAPRDTWSLDHYLAGVMGGSITHLANTKHGSPAGYPQTENIDYDTPTDHEQWKNDLLRWASDLTRFATDDYYELHGHKAPSFADWHADEAARQERLHTTLREMEPWFEALWD